jgi:hypothetical protein
MHIRREIAEGEGRGIVPEKRDEKFVVVFGIFPVL